jgi:hypothetical protein
MQNIMVSMKHRKHVPLLHQAEDQQLEASDGLHRQMQL